MRLPRFVYNLLGLAIEEDDRLERLEGLVLRMTQQQQEILDTLGEMKTEIDQAVTDLGTVKTQVDDLHGNTDVSAIGDAVAAVKTSFASVQTIVADLVTSTAPPAAPAAPAAASSE